MRKIGTGVLVAAAALAAMNLLAGAARAEDWGTWPEGSDPAKVGTRIAENLLPRALQVSWARGMAYPEVCCAYGALRLTNETKNEELLNKLVDKYELMLTPRGKSLVPTPNHVDRTVFGVLPLEIYLLKASPEEKAVALAAAKARPPVTPIPSPDNGGAARSGTPGRGGTGRGGATQPATARGTGTPQGRGQTMKAMETTPAAQTEAEGQWASMKLSHQDQMTQLLIMGKEHVDVQWASPHPDGLTDQTRLWVDDMFMITAAECQAYRATGDHVYLDRAAKEMAVYLDKLQQDNGLFYHADDAHFFWGRGNGWFAVGMAELLSDLPADHPNRARIMEGYKKMMAGLLKYQASDGMWRQLIDNADSWEETSGTGMFTFAMARGVSNGWLGADYKAAAKKAWIALSKHVDDQGQVDGCCQGTDKGFTVEYYLGRGRNTGDFHGQAATIWAAWAMLK